MPTTFPGFPKDLFRFLTELKQNNNRDWFNDNKARYRASVVEPVCAFVEAMDSRLKTISEYYYGDPRAHGGSMFRIYRDTRFSKDKTPYKEHVGCHFRHSAGRDAHAPGFYLHLEPKQVFFGGGIWCPPNPVLHKIRTAIATKPSLWEKIIYSKSFVRRFGPVQGDKLKRPPKGFAKDHPQIEQLKFKSFYVIQTEPEKAALKGSFITDVTRAYKSAGPMIEFITNAVGLRY